MRNLANMNRKDLSEERVNVEICGGEMQKLERYNFANRIQI